MGDLFIDHWIVPYGLPTYLLTDNRVQLTKKFFATLCTVLGVKDLATTAYDPQSNSQAERYNKRIHSHLQHYVAEHQNY